MAIDERLLLEVINNLGLLVKEQSKELGIRAEAIRELQAKVAMLLEDRLK